MLFWKAKAGYMPGTTIATKLSDITWTDEGFVSVPVSANSDFIYDNAPQANVQINEAYQWLYGIIGQDADSFYSPFQGYSMGTSTKGKRAWSEFDSLLPSIEKNFPNLYAIVKANGSLNTYFYIPSLNIVQSRSNFPFSFMNVLEDDSLGAAYNASIPWGGSIVRNVSYSNVYSFYVLDHYKSPSDLIDPDNYKQLELEFNQYTSSGSPIAYKRRYQKRYVFNFYGELTSIFGDNPNPPDSIGGPVNPYEPGGISGEGDLPPGTFDDDSDPIPDSTLPTLSAANTGFTRIYNPTLAQVQSLAQYLWTSDNIVETLWNKVKQFFEDPMQAIIGFNLVPVPVPDAGSEEFALMYIGTGVYMNVAANQFVDVDCGTLEIKRYYGSALDQSPNTKISCFLPFIGTVQLNCDEVMGTTLQVKYRVDIVSGSCVAKIFVDGSCLYQYSGHCAITIPFSSADFSNYVNAAIQVAKLVGTAIAGGAGALMAAGVEDVSQETNYVVTRITDTVHTNRRGAVSGSTHQVQTTSYPQQQEQSQTSASFAGLSPANIANTVAQVVSSKPVIEHSGSFSGNSGYLGIRRPFVIIERPNMCLPADYQALNGYPAMITMTLGDCKGYTRVQQVQLTGLTATNPEQAEILQLLKSGVVF